MSLRDDATMLTPDVGLVIEVDDTGRHMRLVLLRDGTPEPLGELTVSTSIELAMMFFLSAKLQDEAEAIRLLTRITRAFDLVVVPATTTTH